jgi:FAS-associated factor 2
MFNCLFNTWALIWEAKRLREGNQDALTRNHVDDDEEYSQNQALVESEPHTERMERHDNIDRELDSILQNIHLMEQTENGEVDASMAELIREQERLLQSIASQRNPPQQASSTDGTFVDGFATNSGDSLIQAQDHAYLQSLRRDQEKEQQARRERERLEEEARLQKQKEEEEARKRRQRIELRQQKAEEFAKIEEPDQNDAKNKGQVTKVLFRMPDGVTRVTRHFRHTDTLGMLFDFLDVNNQLDVENYQLVTSYPTRRYNVKEHSNITLKDAGLSDNQIALFVSEKV